jgi:hypothetical protein
MLRVHNCNLICKLGDILPGHGQDTIKLNVNKLDIITRVFLVPGMVKVFGYFRSCSESSDGQLSDCQFFEEDFVLFCILFVCKCVLFYCHWVSTQLPLTKYSIFLQDVNHCHYSVNLSLCSCVLNKTVSHYITNNSLNGVLFAINPSK